jgi:hypothetical protein
VQKLPLFTTKNHFMTKNELKTALTIAGVVALALLLCFADNF